MAHSTAADRKGLGRGPRRSREFAQHLRQHREECQRQRLKKGPLTCCDHCVAGATTVNSRPSAGGAQQERLLGVNKFSSERLRGRAEPIKLIFGKMRQPRLVVENLAYKRSSRNKHSPSTQPRFTHVQCAVFAERAQCSSSSSSGRYGMLL